MVAFYSIHTVTVIIVSSEHKKPSKVDVPLHIKIYVNVTNNQMDIGHTDGQTDGRNCYALHAVRNA